MFMQKLIFLLVLFSSSIYGYSYTNQILIDDMASNDNYRMGYSSGFIRGIAYTYKPVCIPIEDDGDIYQTVMEYVLNEKEYKHQPARIAVKMALITKWECNNETIHRKRIHQN